MRMTINSNQLRQQRCTEEIRDTGEPRIQPQIVQEWLF